MDVSFRTCVRTPTGSRIIAGTAEVVGLPAREGWQIHNVYITEGLRHRAADFWELAAVRRYFDRDDVVEHITKLWSQTRETEDDMRVYRHISDKERPIAYTPSPRQKAVLDFVRAEVEAGRAFPSREAIAKHMGWIHEHRKRQAFDVLMILSGMGKLERYRNESQQWEFALPAKADA